ncbi:membrane fusion protein, multidrug efflux system [Rhodospira trueperi]|uniref:Membrane fusion protein, multidrug efflux system n=1 Tax=Rhodospira trueperi TaxID=69960 RepID=A0A1G7BVA0_9PROT|nr:membrane fusion protein, multidrug efflux system [Rhodospira trueperi]
MNTDDPRAARSADDAPEDGQRETDSEDGPGRRKPPIRRIVLSVFGIAVLAGALWLGWRWWTVYRFVEETDDAYVKADIVTISPQVSGEVVRVAVEDHQPVAAGDLLFVIDASDYQAAVDAARAAVASAEALLAETAEERALQDRTVAVAEADLEAAKATLDFARQEYDRDSRLAREGAGTVRAVQQSRESLSNAEAAVNSGVAVLARARKQLDVIDARRTRLESDRDRAAAQLRAAEVNLARTVVRSPAAGRVGNRQIDVGEYVRPGVHAVSVVPDDAYIVANFKETQVTFFETGMACEIEADMLGGAVLHGTIESLAPAAGQEFAILPPQNATGNFTKIVQRIPVKIRFVGDQADAARLRPGTSVIVSVDTKEQRP